MKGEDEEWRRGKRRHSSFTKGRREGRFKAKVAELFDYDPGHYPSQGFSLAVELIDNGSLNLALETETYERA